MKKIAFVAALGVALSGQAMAKSYGPFIQIEGATTQFQTNFEKGKLKIKNFSPRVGAGYKDNNFRIMLDYQNFDEGEKTHQNYSATTTEKMRGHSIGLGFYHDFDNTTNFTPFVGLRASHNMIKHTYQDSQNYIRETIKSTGVGGVVGVNYRFNDELSFNVSGEYNFMGTFDFPQESEVPVNQYGVSAGFRYWF